jgi:hypothetical protein
MSLDKLDFCLKELCLDRVDEKGGNNPYNLCPDFFGIPRVGNKWNKVFCVYFQHEIIIDVLLGGTVRSERCIVEIGSTLDLR